MADGATFHFHLAKPLHAGQAQAASNYRARAGADANRVGHVVGGLVGWSGDRSELWDAAEAAETPKRDRPDLAAKRTAAGAQMRERTVARSVVIALPETLPPAERERLVRGMALWMRDRHGVAVQWDVHEPDPKGDHRNHHAHLLLTSRQVDAGGKFGTKTRELSVSTSSAEHILAWREEWAKRTNRALEKQGSTARISHKTKADVAAETGAIPIPPRPRTTAKEYVSWRAEEGRPPPPPIEWSKARRAAEIAEDLRQQVVATQNAIQIEESIIARLQARITDYARRIVEQARSITTDRHTKGNSPGTERRSRSLSGAMERPATKPSENPEL